MSDEYNNNTPENNSGEYTDNIKSNSAPDSSNVKFESTEPVQKNAEYNYSKSNDYNSAPPLNNNSAQNQWNYNYNNQSAPPNYYTNFNQQAQSPAPQQAMPQNNFYQNTMQQNSPYYLYNGLWYYNPNIASNTPKKKMSTSMKVFLTIIFSLLGIMLGVLIVLCSIFGSDMLKSISADRKNNSDYNDYYPDYDYYGDYDNYGNYGNYDNYGGSFNKNPDEDNEDNYPDYSNPNGPSIELKEGANKTSGNSQSAFEKLAPSVVAITTYSDTAKSTSSSSDFGTPKLLGEGTGLIISDDGYIITNSHVINGSKKYKVTVTLDNSNEYDAKIVGYDERTDLAVLKIDTTEDLTPCEFADSKSLSIGQDVIAIGNPGGKQYSNSITKGIISALDRQVSSYPVLFIQTDTAINPGNSGGPLANLDGKVIGITNIKVVDTEYEGMGFAIPSTTVKKIVEDLIKNGKVTGRAALGITCNTFALENITNPYDYLGIRNGIYVGEVKKNSPLYGKLKTGDVITAIDNTELTGLSDLYNILTKFSPNDEVTLTIYRPNEGKKEIKTTLIEN